MNGIELVEFNVDFFDLSKEWLSDIEINHLTNAGQLPSEEKRLLWFVSLPSRSDYLIWGVKYNGRPIGVSGLKQITNNRAEYWGYIGDKTLWGRGLGKEMLCETLQKAKERGLSGVYLKVRKFNQRAFHLYLKFGFKIDKEESDVYCMSIPL